MNVADVRHRKDYYIFSARHAHLHGTCAVSSVRGSYVPFSGFRPSMFVAFINSLTIRACEPIRRVYNDTISKHMLNMIRILYMMILQ